MLLSLKPAHVKRYAEIARLLVRHGRGDLVRQAGLDEVLKESVVPVNGSVAAAEELARDLERMGPTYVKIGQLLSTRSDLLPPAYLEALSRLQTHVAPFPLEQVEEILREELGIRVSKAFSEFDPKPLAAASLGQVHGAALRDGRPVAVKVQRPGIRERIWEDFEAIGPLADFFDRHTEAGRRLHTREMLEEFRRTLMRELDYRREAQNLTTLAANLAEFDRLLVPCPIEDYTTSRVLTMEYVRGTKITKLSPLVRMELDGQGLAEQLFQAYLKQFVVDGFMHADPHPGNVFLTPDGKLALLDLGMVVRVPPRLQSRLLQLLIALAEARSEDAAEVAVEIGTPADDFDRAVFQRRVADLVAHYQGMRMGRLDVGRIVMEIGRVSSECRIHLPSELTIVGQTLMKLDQVGTILNPAFDPHDAIRRHAGGLTQRRLRSSLTKGNFLNALIEGRDFLEKLPARANRIAEKLATDGLRLHVDALDEESLMEGMQKVANRIALGLVLAALIVGAALLMRVPTPFTLWGYPGLAMILFAVAALGGLGLAGRILMTDVHSRFKKRRPKIRA